MQDQNSYLSHFNQFAHPMDNGRIVKEHEMKQNTLLTNEDTFFRTNRLVIDSRDRDRSVYPDPNNYRVRFNDNSEFAGSRRTGSVQEYYRNVVAVQLVDCQLPTPTIINNATTGGMYITLDIPELQSTSTYDGTNGNLSNVFSILVPDVKVGRAFSPCKFHNPSINKFYTPLASLDSMTIKFKNWDGTPYDFQSVTSETTPPTDPEATIQHMLLFNVITKHKSHPILNPFLTQ